MELQNIIRLQVNALIGSFIFWVALSFFLLFVLKNIHVTATMFKKIKIPFRLKGKLIN